MAIPSRQIGVSTSSNLLWQISKQLEYLICVRQGGCTTTTTTTIAPINFDITANWNLTTPNVTDEASFKTFLESGEDGNGNTSNLTDVVISNFSLVDGRLRCNLSAATNNYLFLGYTQVTNVVSTGNIIGLRAIYFDNNQITSIDNIVWPDGLETISLYDNLIDTFNPVTALPNTLLELNLSSNSLSSFDPIIPLPNSLENLNLNQNRITIFNPSIPLPSGLQILYLILNQIITFNPSIALPNGLLQLFLTDNQIVIFNPSIPLPNSLTNISLYRNLMTTAGYTASEPWANAMTNIPGRGTIYLNENSNSANGTALKSILISKGWSVIA